MKILMVPNYVLPLGYGLTLYKLVIINKTAEDIPYVIAHESKHVEQWTRIGFFKFPYLYIKELIAVGYWENKYERSAREYGMKNKHLYIDFIK
jgi:hypothetical protein